MVKTGKNFLNAKKAFEGKHDLSLDEAVNLVKNNASSTAVLPPPITATFLFLKKNASQVAQAETP